MKKLILLAGLLFMISCSGKKTADLIVHNAVVYTVDSAMTIAEAFAVKDGKFLFVGSNDDVLNNYEAAEVINAEGMPVYPGLIDAHCHFYAYALYEEKLNLIGTKSFDEVIEKVVAYAAAKPDGWIEGRGWDQNDWEVKEYPTKDTLDKLFPDRPIYLSRVDGHAALVNQAALDAAQVNESTKIAGGEVVLKNGKPIGILIDNAADSARAVIPQPNAEHVERALLNAQHKIFAVGLTTVDDAGLDKAQVETIDRLQKAGKLKVRVYAMLNPSEENKEHYFKNGVIKSDNLTVSAFKIYGDGSLGSRGAALLEPYADKEDHTGFLMQPAKYYYSIAKQLYSHGFQMNTHCIGDSANRLMLDVYNYVLNGKNDRRWRIEHAQVVNEQDFKLFSKSNIIPSVQPTHATSDMYWAEVRVGEERIKGAYAYQTLLKQNGYIALGSDFPVESINPLLGFYAAISRQDVKGFPESGFRPGEALTREQALRGMTIWAAYSNFEEKKKGSIEQQKLADFVVLDRDIMKIPVHELPKTQVSQTWIGGKRVYISE